MNLLGESDKIILQIQEICGKRVAGCSKISRGLSLAERFLLHFDDNTSAFTKIAADIQTANWLRNEHKIYSSINAPFVPRLIGWHDDGERPFLITEDLSRAHWPPPWSEDQIESVLATLEQVAQVHDFVNEFEHLEEQRSWLSGWTVVESDPSVFLRLELCSENWLSQALPTLLATQETAVLDGRSLIHFETRSDNLCFAGCRCVLVDWSRPRIGEPTFDVARWLPGLHAEGGPLPEVILPNGAPYAALLSGFWAARAGLPPSPRGPGVRALQTILLKEALPWAVRSLGLPPLDGKVL